jgi:hypothetical protein
LLTAARDYAADLTRTYALPGAVNAEDQLKPAVARLLKAVGARFMLTVETRTEAQPEGLGARPDVAVYVGSLLCGYVELKQPGLGADPDRLRGEQSRKQWAKFKSLPNLIYTDGRDWALFRTGERTGSTVQLPGNPTQDGAAAIDSRSAADLESLLRDFLYWKPIVPHDPLGLAKYLAPLARLLRDEAEVALGKENSAIALLAREWRQFFFPEADDHQFADAYAQTVTYALLLARLSGAGSLQPNEASKILNQGNSLLAETLKLLGQDEARDELALGFDLLRRSLEALDAHDFLKAKPDLWLYFYEDFLAAYDPRLRADYGVYYTPREVVELQVRLASELLDTRFGKRLGFADEEVRFLDPAVGTGTYLVAATSHALAKVEARSGTGAVPGRASQIARNMYGFEILVGPYAVAHLRLTQEITGVGGVLPDGRVQLYLADTLESPNRTPPGGLDLTHRKLTEEREKARKIKKSGHILVCLGNPPYDRQQIKEEDTQTRRKGGWVRNGDQVEGGATPEQQGGVPILEDFLKPARVAGAGVHLKNLYNDYVYFWRWALWRLFEAQQGGGIVTFITASSYLAGPGFVGMREFMRRTFDELWVIDLGGDNLGTRRSENVFNIQIPVAIAIGIRGPKGRPEIPAVVHYSKVEGSRSAKLARLAATENLTQLKWASCHTAWHATFLPAGKGDYFSWPGLEQLFPYRRSGSKFGRTWPIGETREVLEKRWKALLAVPNAERGKLFHDNKYRKIGRAYSSHHTGHILQKIALLDRGAEPPEIVPYAFRSFDRQWAFADNRLNDRMGAPLWWVAGPNQLYMTTLFSFPTAYGPVVTVAAHVPDLHHFRGSFGGKDAIPLWRDAAATQPNVTKELLDRLATEYKRPVAPEDLAAYVYGLLGGLSYTKRFWEELATPGPRVPLTRHGAIFLRAATLGRRLLWLHTYGERMREAGREGIPPGIAKCLSPVPDMPAGYPETFEYRPVARELRVGEGRFGPVSHEVWAYEVSGLQVVRSWLGYRMKRRSGRHSSPLDDIRPSIWTPRLTDELLELLWVLEATIAMEPELSAMLDAVVAGPCFRADELPMPTDDERRPPRRTSTRNMHLFEDNSEWADEDDEAA